MRVAAFGRGSGPTGAVACFPARARDERGREERGEERALHRVGAAPGDAHTRGPPCQGDGYLSASTSPQAPFRPQALKTPPWKMRSWYWLSARVLAAARAARAQLPAEGPGRPRTAGVGGAAGDVELARLALRVPLGPDGADGAPVGEPDLRAVGGIRPDEGGRIEDPRIAAPLVDLDVELGRGRAGAGCRSRRSLPSSPGSGSAPASPPRSGSGWASARAPPGPACPSSGSRWARAWDRPPREAAGRAASGFRRGASRSPTPAGRTRRAASRAPGS